MTARFIALRGPLRCLNRRPLRAALGAALVPAFVVACDAPVQPPADLTPLPSVVTLEPGVRIDGYEEDLVPLSSGALRGDGLVAFVQSQDGKILFHDSTGARVGEFGSQGDGPGEFQLPARLGWTDGRLWVDDVRHRRLTWIALDPEPRMDGEFGYRSLGPIQGTDGLPNFRAVWPRGVYPDGSLLASLGGAEDAPEFEGMDALARVDTAGRVLRGVAVYPANSGMVSLSQEEGGNVVSSIATSAPWTLRTVVDYPGLGGSAVVVTTSPAPGPAAELRVISFEPAAGDTAFDVRLLLDAEELTERVADSAIAARIDGMSEEVTESWPEFADVYRREVEVPPIYPVVMGVTKGLDGRVWLRLWPEGAVADSAAYLVLDASGRPEFRTGVPRGSIMMAAADHVWVNETDSLGVGSLVRYAVPDAR